MFLGVSFYCFKHGCVNWEFEKDGIVHVTGCVWYQRHLWVLITSMFIHSSHWEVICFPRFVFPYPNPSVWSDLSDPYSLKMLWDREHRDMASNHSVAWECYACERCQWTIDKGNQSKRMSIVCPSSKFFLDYLVSLFLFDVSGTHRLI